MPHRKGHSFAGWVKRSAVQKTGGPILRIYTVIHNKRQHICDHNSGNSSFHFYNFCTAVSRKNIFTHIRKTCSPHLNNGLCYLVKMKHHISYFHNAVLDITNCIKRGVKHKVHEVEKTNWQSQNMFKVSTSGPNTSTQACWPLLNCVINKRLVWGLPHMQQTLLQLISVTVMTVTSYLRHM